MTEMALILANRSYCRKRYNNNFNTAYKCSKPSFIYKKTKKPLFNFHVPLHPFHCAKLEKDL